MSRSGIVKSWLVVAGLLLASPGVPSVSAQQAFSGQETPVPSAQQELQRALDTGRQELEDGNYDAAVNAYSQIIQAYDIYSPAEAYLGRAKAFEALREFRAAIRDYSSALEMNDNLAEAYNGRGEIRLQFSGMSSTAVSDALADFLKAVENDRTNPAYAVNLAKAYVRLGGQYATEARSSVNRAIRMDENNAEAYRTRAQVYALLQDFEAATTDIAKATELEPDNHENHYVMGMIHMQNKQHQAAVQAFYRAKETYTPEDPDDPAPYVEPYLAASLAYIELGKEAGDPQVKQDAYVKAIEETQKALEEQPTLPLAMLNRGVAFRLLELYSDARDAFTEAIQMAPNFAEAYFRRGIVWYYMGQLELARKDFREAIAINYDDVRPYLWMGVTYADEGSYHEAIIQYGEAINLNPRYVPAYVNRGLAYAQIGEYEKAEDNFNDAIRLEPSEATHYFKRGTVLMAMERYDDALRAYSNAISNAPYYVDAYRKAGDALQRLGRTDLATRYRQQANEVEAAIRAQIEEYRQQSQEPGQRLGRAEGLPTAEDVLSTPEEDAAVPAEAPDAFAPAGDVPATTPDGPDVAVPNPFENFGPLPDADEDAEGELDLQ